MNLFIWIIVGCIIGAISYVSLRLMNTIQQRNELLINIIAGGVGALLGGFLLAPIFGNGSIDVHHYSNGKLFVAIIGAIFLLVLINASGQLNKKH